MRKLMPFLFLPILLVGCDDTKPAEGGMPDRVALDGQLSQEDALKAMNANIPSLVPCTQAAKLDAAVELRLSWSVLPDGKVTKTDIQAADGTLDEELKKCIAAAMIQWTFPASKIGTRIEAIPLKLGG